MYEQPKDEMKMAACGAVCNIYCTATSNPSSVVCQLCPVGILRTTVSANGYKPSLSVYGKLQKEERTPVDLRAN